MGREGDEVGHQHTVLRMHKQRKTLLKHENNINTRRNIKSNKNNNKGNCNHNNDNEPNFNTK